MGLPGSRLSEFLNDHSAHKKQLDSMQREKLFKDYSDRLCRAGLPHTEALWLAAQPGGPEPEPEPPPPPPPAAPPVEPKRALPVFSVNLRDPKHHTSGMVHVMALGTAPAATDQRWAFPCPVRGTDPRNRLLRVRFGLRARITFGAAVRGLGGRTFEWE
eukprot:5320874-Prymnesium_polylepis.1